MMRGNAPLFSLEQQIEGKKLLPQPAMFCG